MLRQGVRKAGITVYAALILGVMVALIITCLTSARMAAARAQIADSARIGLFSLFAGYDRQLLDEYEIFGLNTGGSPTAGDLARVCGTAEYYMKQILGENSQNLVLQKTGLSGYRLLTDDGGEPFYRQAVLYEKGSPASDGVLKDLQSWKEAQEELQSCLEEGRREEEADWFNRYEAAVEEALRLSREAAETAGEDLLTSVEEEAYAPDAGAGSSYSSLSSPVSVIRSIHDRKPDGLLLTGIREKFGGGPSAPLISERPVLSGMGIPDGFHSDETAGSELLFQAYIQEKFVSCLKPASAFPVCQMEYILEGEKNDAENLSRAAEKILMARMGAALRQIDGNDALGTQVRGLTESICSLFLVPPDAEVVQGTLRYCWAYGEGMCELSCLLEGGRIPLQEPGEFMVPLDGLYTLMDYLGKSEENSGCCYEDFLGILMLGLPKAMKLMRTMECVESSVRSSGRSGFYLDHCMTDAEISADVRANGRKTFTVTKSFGYS